LPDPLVQGMLLRAGSLGHNVPIRQGHQLLDDLQLIRDAGEQIVHQIVAGILGHEGSFAGISGGG
ncbi:hypothetical protein EBT31_17225, partial [bacterium]|nr:hypothetical protein [bacterium]